MPMEAILETIRNSWVLYILYVLIILPILNHWLEIEIDRIRSKPDHRIKCKETRIVLYSKKRKYKEKTINKLLQTYPFVIEQTLRFTNTGKKDLLGKDVVEPLKIELPNGFWVESATPKPSDKNCKITKTIPFGKKNIQLNWNIFRKNSHFDLNITAVYAGTIKNDEDYYFKHPKIEKTFYPDTTISIVAADTPWIQKYPYMYSVAKFNIRRFFVTMNFPAIIASFILFFLIIWLMPRNVSTSDMPIKCEANVYSDTDSSFTYYHNVTISYNIEKELIILKTNDSVVCSHTIDDFEKYVTMENCGFQKTILNKWSKTNQKSEIIKLVIVVVSLVLFVIIIALTIVGPIIKEHKYINRNQKN